MKKAVLMKNITLFIVGFCSYITIESCFRGYSYFLMGICGGISVVIIDKLNSKISWNMDILLQGCIGSIIITAMELTVGIICKIYAFEPMWDYSNIWMNYDGIICLPFSLIWIFLSIVAILLADTINYYIFNEMPVPYYKLFGKIIFKFKEKKQ